MTRGEIRPRERENSPSFRGAASGASREPGIHNHGETDGARCLWIPGCLAALGPRNDETVRTRYALASNRKPA